MKKIYSLAAVALMTLSASAATDGRSYETTNGIKCENVWIYATNYNKSDLTAIDFLNTNKCRTAALHDGYVYVGNSTNYDGIVGSDGKSVDCAGVEVFDAKTGAFVRKIKVTCDGEPVTGLLCANQVCFDSFGNLFVAGYVSSSTYGYKVYAVNKETGVAVKHELFMTNDARID